MKKITRINGSLVEISTAIPESMIHKVNAFSVTAKCDPVCWISDKEMMLEVCKYLTRLYDLEIRTLYVATDSRFVLREKDDDYERGIEEITFQVLTPLDSLW